MAGPLDPELYQPEHFYFHITMTVRFGDVDALGHVNNAKYLTYMEQARVSYARDILGWNTVFSALGLIMANAWVEYKSALQFGERVYVFARCTRLGNKSFDMAYLLRRDQDGQPGDIAATGFTGLVAYDYAAQQTVPIPEDWREKMLAFEVALQGS